jgi:iron complex outermembrane receptor protein
MKTLLLFLLPACLLAGSIRGKATLKSNGQPIGHVIIRLMELNRAVQTLDNGTYEIRNVPAGKYNLVAHLHALTDEVRQVEVGSGDATVDFVMDLGRLRQEVTITASGREELVGTTVATVTTVPSYDLATRTQASALGEMLEDQVGVSKRSFGPGSSRPVIRGFDGDRVLVLQDGARTGTLSSQSGDHGEPFDAQSIERVEIVRGPQTLLYGTNAIGGVVNVISSHDDLNQSSHEGVRGYVSGLGGTANALGSGSAGIEFGRAGWQVWGGGGGNRTGEYQTPLGKVENSETEYRNGRVGAGRFGQKLTQSLVFNYQGGRYGIPPLEEAGADDSFPKVGARSAVRPPRLGAGEELIDLSWRRYSLRSLTNRRVGAGAFENLNLMVNYSNWQHKELEGAEVGTVFDNRQFSLQPVLRQRRKGLFAGDFGFFFLDRDFAATGDEALSPPVRQRSFAGFGVEELNFERVKLQFGGRVERNGYKPQRDLPERSFTGFSGAVGGAIRLDGSSSVVLNYTHSYRAPALEELYFNGPHAGNLAFEIGDADLKAERANGFEGGFRHRSGRVRAEVNGFYYNFSDYVFLARGAEIEDGFPVAPYRQGDARYAGAEWKVDVMAARWLNLTHQFDVVRATLTDGDVSLPRIPPVRARFGAEWRWKGLTVKPELALAAKQDRLYPGETETDGWAVFGTNAFYTIATRHVMHTFSVTGFNLNDRLYRNHVSFIKDFAPEIGRGVRFGYTMNFY